LWPVSRRTLLIAAVVLAFAAVSTALARFLTTEGRERSALAEVLEDQARGDAAGVLARLEACDARCARVVRAAALRVRGPGEVKIVRLDSETAYSAFGRSEGWSRVVWALGPEGIPKVQCVRVRREGNPLTGRSVTLLALRAPLADNEGSC
jgi:hypothetical protein